jgi:hypothetical protein
MLTQGWTDWRSGVSFARIERQLNYGNYFFHGFREIPDKKTNGRMQVAAR